MTNKTVTIFGVFDGIHDGHKYFIREAKKLGSQLVVIVARDDVVTGMKGKSPVNNEVERINSLLTLDDIDLVLLGDAENGTYKILKEVNPDIICLGYDQKKLHENIETCIKKGNLPEIELVCINSHKPETLHSSLLNKKYKIKNSEMF